MVLNSLHTKLTGPLATYHDGYIKYQCQLILFKLHTKLSHHQFSWYILSRTRVKNAYEICTFSYFSRTLFYNFVNYRIIAKNFI